MAIIKSISTRNITNLDKYILDGEAHDKTLTTHRNLLTAGHNIKKDYAGHFNAMYTASQNYAVRKLAGKTGKKTQGFHLIISFSDQDFPKTKDAKKLQEQAHKAYDLVHQLLDKELPSESQYLVGIQRDGKGGMLHAHVAVNSVLTNGKTLDTNQLSLNHKLVMEKQPNGTRKRVKHEGLYQRMQDFFESKFEKVTGRKYEKVERDKSDLVKSNEKQLSNKGVKLWKDELKDEIVEIAQRSASADEFKQLMRDVYGVEITEKRASIGKDKQGHKQYRLAYSYKFTTADGKKHTSRDIRHLKNGAIRGLGVDYTPQALDKQFEFVRNQQASQQAELARQQQDIEQSKSNIKKVEVIKNGTQSIQNEPEFEYGTNGTSSVKKVKQVTISNRHKSYDTSFYSEETDDINRNNQRIADQINQENIRRQRQEAERKRREREQERKQRERLNRRREEKPKLPQGTINQATESTNDLER